MLTEQGLGTPDLVQTHPLAQEEADSERAQEELPWCRTRPGEELSSPHHTPLAVADMEVMPEHGDAL